MFSKGVSWGWNFDSRGGLGGRTKKIFQARYRSPWPPLEHPLIFTLDGPEILWTKTADKVKGSKCYLELYSLKHMQPAEDITKDRSEMVKLAGTNNQTFRRRYYSSQTGSQRRLQPEYVERRLSWTAAYTSKLPQLVEAAMDDVPARRAGPSTVHRQ